MPAHDLTWPGDHRAGRHLSDDALVDALVDVEQAWLAACGSGARLDGLVGEADLSGLAERAEASGTPVLPLVGLLRERLAERGAPGDADAARALHRGLTSQDVLDTALVLLLADAVADLGGVLDAVVDRLAALAERHRDTPMAARTLGRPAVPTTFGLKVATWLTGVLDARDDLRALRFPAQLGGAAGTLAGPVAVGGAGAVAALPERLGLASAPPWHTTRRPVTRAGDALVAVTDALGRVANDVLVLSRPEVGELTEGSAGASSTMPHKANPVLAVLVRRAALAAPPLGAALHAAAADASDERTSGGWHAEWSPLRLLGRRTLVAAAQTRDLLAGLVVHPDRMAANANAWPDDLHAEQCSLAPDDHGPWLGDSGRLVDDAVARARTTSVPAPAPEEPPS